jgi:type IV secretory pathway TrbL component
MICGVFFTVLLYLKDIPDVLASTTEIGLGETLENGSTLVKMEELIGEIAFLFTEWLDKVSIFDVSTIIINGLLFLSAIIVLLAIMIQYVLLYLSTYFIVICGTFALALGGISVNNDLAMGYLRKLASIAIEFLTLGLMMSITVGLVRKYVNDTQEYSVISMLSMNTDYFNNSSNLFFFVIEILIIGVLTVSIPGKVASLIGGTGSNGSPIGALAVAGAIAGGYKKLTSTPIMGGEKGPTISSTLNAGAVKATSAVGSTIKAGFVGTGGAVKAVAKTGLDTLSEKIQKFSAKRNSEKITK